MTLKDLQSQALLIAGKYDQKNQAEGRPQWDASAYMAGFVGDVGDLSKLVMAKANLRQIDHLDQKLAHELSDCLWAVLVLAKQLNIDLEAEFARTIAELDTRLTT